MKLLSMKITNKIVVRYLCFWVNLLNSKLNCISIELELNCRLLNSGHRVIE